MFEFAVATLDPPPAVTEIDRARQDPALFIDRYCWLTPMGGGKAIRFHLWPFQHDVLEQVQRHELTVTLKARQLGLSWLLLAYAL